MHIIQINKNVTPTITVQNRVTVYIVVTIFDSRGERGERRMIDDQQDLKSSRPCIDDSADVLDGFFTGAYDCLD